MKDRCYQPTHIEYKRYGALGISVCDEWKKSFENFLKDMGERPDGCSLERIDGKKNYCRSNCVWANAQQQANNRKSNRIVEFNGERMTLAEWSRKTGIHQGTIWARLHRGWDISRALTA